MLPPGRLSLACSVAHNGVSTYIPTNKWNITNLLFIDDKITIYWYHLLDSPFVILIYSLYLNTTLYPNPNIFLWLLLLGCLSHCLLTFWNLLYQLWYFLNYFINFSHLLLIISQNYYPFSSIIWNFFSIIWNKQ